MHYNIQAAQHLCDGLHGNGKETHHYLEVRYLVPALHVSLHPPPGVLVYKLKGLFTFILRKQGIGL